MFLSLSNRCHHSTEPRWNLSLENRCHTMSNIHFWRQTLTKVTNDVTFGYQDEIGHLRTLFTFLSHYYLKILLLVYQTWSCSSTCMTCINWVLIDYWNASIFRYLLTMSCSCLRCLGRYMIEHQFMYLRQHHRSVLDTYLQSRYLHWNYLTYFSSPDGKLSRVPSQRNAWITATRVSMFSLKVFFRVNDIVILALG